MTSDEAAAHGGGTASKAGPPAFDTSVAHQARMYDYFLGGKENYAADRDAAEAWLKTDPKAAFSSRANRAFLGRAVRYLAGDAGMRKFLDIGTGIPAAGNTHQIAQAIVPESRAAYVDYDRCKSGCAHAWAAGQQQTKPPRDRQAADSLAGRAAHRSRRRGGRASRAVE